jgi:hypothetical protein
MSDDHKVGWLGKTWIVGVFGFSVFRALLVWPTLGDKGVNPWLFLIIDVVTAWPYAYGQVRVINEARARDWSGVRIWAAIVMLAFLAPYAYIAGAGSGEMPLIAWIVIGALMAVFGTASVVRILRQIRQPEPEPEPV